MTLHSGDRVRLVTRKHAFEGLLLPEREDVVVLKLDSGYNIGVLKRHVDELLLLEEKQVHEEEKSAVAQAQDLPRVTILHTGGTIASKVDYETGAVFSRFTPEELIAQFPELQSLAHIESRLLRNMSSDDIRFAHLNIIARAIEQEVAAGVKGIIITMGTDNLAVVSAGLSFVLQNLSIPVLLVGAQRSSDRGGSDAAMNLLCATQFIVQTDFCGVALCMHQELSDTTCAIFPAAQTRKMHSSTRSAFKSINQQIWATVDYETKLITWIRPCPEKPTEVLELKLFNEKLHIGHLKAHINMFASEVLAYDDFDGLIIEGTGLGHFPINAIDDETQEHKKIYNALKDLITHGTLVVMATQTIYGQVNMKVYSPGRRLLDIGVLGDETDLPPETAYVKLAWLLSTYPKEQVAEQYTKNICGELSERREP